MRDKRKYQALTSEKVNTWRLADTEKIRGFNQRQKMNKSQFKTTTSPFPSLF